MRSLPSSVYVIFVVLVFILAIACERMKWQECRKYHPAWYCFATGGGH